MCITMKTNHKFKFSGARKSRQRLGLPDERSVRLKLKCPRVRPA